MSDPVDSPELREWLKGELAKNEAEKVAKQPWWLKPEFLMALATLVSSILGGLKARDAAIDSQKAMNTSQENQQKIGAIEKQIEKGNKVLYMKYGAPAPE